MRCRKARELISLYLAPDDSWLSPNDRQALEAHMAVCEPCHRDYRESREVIGVLQKCWQVSEDTAALLEKGHRQGRHGGSARVVKPHGFFRRVAVWAVAACLVIAALGGWAALHRGALLPEPGRSVALTGEGLPLVITLADGGHITPGAVIQTSAREIGNLVLNGRHRVVMNAGTRLSIRSLFEADQAGCLMSLALGEVYVHVEHDGHPFIVETAHGKAVITGTTFDVKATDVGTTLVVVEGSVRFESTAGVVQVTAGQWSEIAGSLALPSMPAPCDSVALTAWARSAGRGSQVAQDIRPEDFLPGDMAPFPSPGIRTDLKGINCAQWVKLSRDWFRRQFPDIFRLREALAQEGVEVDYPDLLLESAVVWQFAYPPTGRDRLVAADDAAIIRAANHHGKNVQWLKNRCLVPVARTATNRQKQMMDAFALWQNELATAVDSGEEVPRELLLDSLHVCVYLRQTRSLVWLAVEADRYSLPDTPKAQLQALLQAEVTAADSGVNDVIRLLATERSMMPCDSDPYRQLVHRLCEAITQMIQTEERLADEIADRHP
ncbi:MAG: FecR domain-containing protein [Phycisphaerales bacterium]|nr:MAG: FecR domain-containing protein [Phycisphaerales bacterium]